ncbi:hypothetical protein F4806DRAFT_492727 [Annulohypoxylon nitens]|nr:hypothetical protein F4806DRAFT_492727 [Annulohypoxylon nitens]
MYRADIAVSEPSKKSKKRSSEKAESESHSKRSKVEYLNDDTKINSGLIPSAIKWPPFHECALRICDEYGAVCYNDGDDYYDDRCHYCASNNLDCKPLNMNSKTVDAIQELRYAVEIHAIFGGSDGDDKDTKTSWINAANRVRRVIGRTCKRQEKPGAVARPGSAVESVNSIAGLNLEIPDLLRKINANLGNFATAIEKVTAATATEGCN